MSDYKFKVGDRVRSVSDLYTYLKKGVEGVVIGTDAISISVKPDLESDPRKCFICSRNINFSSTF